MSLWLLRIRHRPPATLRSGVLRHRVGLQPDAEIEGLSADDCVEEILREVRVPETIAA